MEPRRPAFRLLMAELARAHRAIERGASEEARAAVQAALAIDPHNVQALQWLEQLDRASATAPAPPAKRPPEGPRPPKDPRTTGGWSAFEQRVRKRRAERCLETAHAAVAAGHTAAALEALDELVELVPGHPGAAALRNSLAASSAVPVPEPTPIVPEALQVRHVPETSVPDVPAAPLLAQSHPPRVEPTIDTLHAAGALEAFAPESAGEAPDAVRQPLWRHRAVFAVAAAVLVAGVLLPVQWSHDRGEVDRLARNEPAAGAGDLALPHASTIVLTESEGEPIENDPPGPDAAAGVTGAADIPVMTTGDEAPLAAQGDVVPPAAAPRDEPKQAERASIEPPPVPRPVSPGRAEQPSAAPAAAAERALLSSTAPGLPATLDEAPETPALVARFESPRIAPPSTQESAGNVSSAAVTGAAATAPSAAMPQPPQPASPQPEPAAAAYVPRPSQSAPPPVETPQEPDGEAAVREVLQRYVRAYNRLDAVAAREVWPAVDQSALERAFSQLDSQSLRFDRCEISLEDRNGTATCAGQARWVPRIGGRDPKREQRTWTFDLSRNGDEWIITRAEARR